MKIAFKMYIAKGYRVIYVVSKLCMKINFYFHADFLFLKKGNYKAKQEKFNRKSKKNKLEKFKDTQIDNFIHPTLICT